MTRSTTPSSPHLPASFAEALSRRRFMALLLAGAGATMVTLDGCGFPAQSGVAFEPWRLPDGEMSAELLAVAAAILAASPHNTQPWRFGIGDGEVDVYADLDKSLGAMDWLHREMYIGLGCALENLVLAAQSAGRQPTVTLLPEAGDERHVARVELARGDAVLGGLFDQIPRRHTNRGAYAEREASPQLEQALRGLVGKGEAVRLSMLRSADARARFRQLTIDATEDIVADREMNEASHRWYRHTEAEIAEHRDGITVDTIGLGATTTQLAKATAHPTADLAGQYWLDATRGRQTTASAFVLLSTDVRDSRAEQLVCGRVYQRMHLWATQRGLAMQPLNQAAELQDREQSKHLEPHYGRRLAELSGDRESTVQMAFRVGYAWDDAPASPRRPLDWVRSEGA